MFRNIDQIRLEHVLERFRNFLRTKKGKVCLLSVNHKLTGMCTRALHQDLKQSEFYSFFHLFFKKTIALTFVGNVSQSSVRLFVTLGFTNALCVRC